MKILVLSDTHGKTESAVRLIRNKQDVDLIIHLGDLVRDAKELNRLFPDIPIDYVCGNCDFAMDPSEKTIQIKGIDIFITHGHKYRVKESYDKLEDKVLEISPKVILFGHTHISEIREYKGCYLINPGSMSYPRGNNKKSYAIIEITDKGLFPGLYYYNE